MSPSRFTSDKLDDLIQKLTAIRDRMLQLEAMHSQDVTLAGDEYKASARNLLHYLALRQHDIRELQVELSHFGLSSLGRAESHTLASVDAVLAVLHRLANRGYARPDGFELPVDFTSGPALLERHTSLLLGEGNPERPTRIMVTLPSQAATEYDLVLGLASAGMDIARINSAHDSPDQWQKMVRNVRRASRQVEKHIQLMMDLSGPKQRTEGIQGGHLTASRGDHLAVLPPDSKGLQVPEHFGERRVHCSLPEIIRDVRVGHRIWFDDGKLGGVVISEEGGFLEVEITHSRPGGGKLRNEKGINLPDTDLQTPSLTEKDLCDLDFAAKNVDMVGFSFVRSGEDVLLLEDCLSERGGDHIGIVLKIENAKAFENLPRLLLVGLRSPPLGVMVARGDLAVEVGFERLAEAQEEILWLSEAAHVPVIWATQVLESLAKKGLPSRAEVTDAAMSVRAECVMLNKGPHITDAVLFLDNILRRMQSHQQKKRATLRRLSVSDLS